MSITQVEMLTPPQASKVSSLTTHHIRELIECKKLPAINVSTKERPRWLIRRTDLEEFLTPVAKRG